jgi:HK97 family phage major capsid protein
MPAEHVESGKAILDAIKGVETDLMKAVADRDAEVKSLGSVQDETKQTIKDLQEKLSTLGDDVKAFQERAAELDGKLQAQVTTSNSERKSLADRFLESSQYQEYKDAGFDKHSRNFEVGHSLGAAESKTFTGAALANTPAYMYQVSRVADYLRDPDRTRFIRELIPTFGVSTGAVEFVRELSYTNNAGMVPEFEDTDSENKPKSALDFEILTVPIRTMAHYLPVTRQIVDDERQLRAYITNRLLYGLRLKEDQQILYGTGTGNEIQGILTQSGIQQITLGTAPSVSGDTFIDVIRRALTLSTVAEYRPSGIVMNHEDWETIELTKDLEERYIWVNVTVDNVTRLWGLPVVTTNAITKGTALVGDFSMGTAIHDRENANIRISDSHADFFTKNLWAILAEERLAQTIYLPKAFTEVTF